MDKKIILGFLILCSLMLIFGSDTFARNCPAYATACDAALSYKITMNQLEVSTTGDATGAVTVVSTPQQFDIAAFNAGAVVGSWFSGVNLAPGTYDWMRRTVSRTFYGQGYVTSGGFDYYTSSNPDTVTFGAGTNMRAVAAGTFPSNPPADYAEIAFAVENPTDWGQSLPPGMTMTATSIIETDTSSPVTISMNQQTRITITFNVSNSLQLQRYGAPTDLTLGLGEPDVEMTVTYE